MHIDGNDDPFYSIDPFANSEPGTKMEIQTYSCNAMISCLFAFLQHFIILGHRSAGHQHSRLSASRLALSLLDVTPSVWTTFVLFRIHAFCLGRWSFRMEWAEHHHTLLLMISRYGIGTARRGCARKLVPEKSLPRWIGVDLIGRRLGYGMSLLRVSLPKV